MLIYYIHLRGGDTINKMYMLTGFASFVMHILPGYGC